jgi:hypothetical protein
MRWFFVVFAFPWKIASLLSVEKDDRGLQFHGPSSARVAEDIRASESLSNSSIMRKSPRLLFFILPG